VLSKYVPSADSGIPRDEGSLRFGLTRGLSLTVSFPALLGVSEVPFEGDELLPLLVSSADDELLEDLFMSGRIIKKKTGKTTAAATKKTTRSAHNPNRVFDFDVGFSFPIYGSGTFRCVGIRSSENWNWRGVDGLN
jgi:hypothetical protein